MYHRAPCAFSCSRCLPLLPEVVACLAGLTRMPFYPFVLSLACGCLPLGFIYAAIGAAGQDNPGLALSLSVAIPAALWAFVQLWLRRHGPFLNSKRSKYRASEGAGP